MREEKGWVGWRKALSFQFNAAVEGIGGDEVRLAAHLCFGNYAGRPLGKRVYAPVVDQMLRFDVDELVLESANREMAELPLLGELAAVKRVAVGVVDIKSYYIETARDMAARARQVLAHVPPDRLNLVPDCGFNQTAWWAERAQLRARGDGKRLVRRDLTGGA